MKKEEEELITLITAVAAAALGYKVKINIKTNGFIGYLIVIAIALVVGGSISGYSAHVDRHFQNIENHDFALDNICLEKLDFLPQDCYSVEAVNYLLKELENKSSYEEAIIKYRKEVLYASASNKWTW